MDTQTFMEHLRAVLYVAITLLVFGAMIGCGLRAATLIKCKGAAILYGLEYDCPVGAGCHLLVDGEYMPLERYVDNKAEIKVSASE